MRADRGMRNEREGGSVSLCGVINFTPGLLVCYLKRKEKGVGDTRGRENVREENNSSSNDADEDLQKSTAQSDSPENYKLPVPHNLVAGPTKF